MQQQRGAVQAGGEAMTCGLYATLTAVWQRGKILRTLKRGLAVPVWAGKGDSQASSTSWSAPLLSVPGKFFAHLLLMQIHGQLLELQGSEQTGITNGESTIERILLVLPNSLCTGEKPTLVSTGHACSLSLSPCQPCLSQEGA